MHLNLALPQTLRLLNRLIFLLALLLVVGFTLFATLYWALVALIFLVFFYAFLRVALQEFRRAVQLQDTPVAGVGSAAQGYVQLRGRLALDPGEPPPQAPLSEVPCHYWVLTLRLIQGKNKWSTQAEARSADFFLPLADASGKGYVLQRMAEIKGQTSQKTLRHQDDLAPYLHFFPADQQQRLVQLSSAERGIWELHETYLPADRPLFATGMLQTVPTTHNPFTMPLAGHEEAGGAAWLVAALQQAQGVSDEAGRQWQAEMQRWPDEAQVHLLTSPEGPQANLAPYPLLLADRDLSELIRYHRRRATFWLVASGLPVLLLVGLVVLNTTVTG